MPRETQSRILRVLVEQRFRRVGGDQDVQVDVRVISSTSATCATRSPPGASARTSSTVSTSCPACSRPVGAARGHPELVDLLRRADRRRCRPAREAGEDALATLQVHAWPGNVRQLRNNVERDAHPGLGRSRRVHHRRNAAVGAGVGGPPARSGPSGSSPCRCGRRAKCSSASISRPDPAVWRQYLAHRRLHRHGALGPAPETEVAGRGGRSR
jgi:hypothetical protein